MNEVKTPTHWVMDLETMVNCFIAYFEHYKLDEGKLFVINRERDDLPELIEFLKENVSGNQWHISFNGLGFDAQITQWILDNDKFLMAITTEQRVAALYEQAQRVILATKNRDFPPYAPWEIQIKQVDIFKANHWDNPAKSSSLKWIQYSIDWFNVEEMPIHHTTPVTNDDDLNMVINYCINDVRSTKKIFHLSKEQIQLRQTLTKEYNIDLYSASEPRISKELFGMFLSKKMGIDVRDLKKMRTPRYNVLGRDIILPYINFKTYEFKAVHEWAMNLDIDFHSKMSKEERDARYKYTMTYKGIKTDYGLGGLHGCAPSGVYEATPGMTIMTSDVTSFYPNLSIRNKWAPAHIPKEIFCEQYEWFFEERKKIPKSDPRNYVYKIILNSTYGLSNDANSFLYDPLMTMQITINGQLSLSMLYEMLAEGIPGARPLMQNTDGLEMMIPTHFVDKYMEICAEWEKMTSLQLEHDKYQKMIIRDVNNYIAINEKGKVKCKGAFDWEDMDKKKVAALHKNKSFLVIPKAIHQYFVNGVKPEDYLKTNRNIYDYCAGVKAKGEWSIRKVEVIKEIPKEAFNISIEEKRKYLKANGWEQSWDKDNWVRPEWSNREANAGIDTESAYASSLNSTLREVKTTEMHKIVRYYISKRGAKLLKVHPDGRQHQVEAGRWMQTDCNDMSKVDENDFDSFNLDMDYYLAQIYKEIENIQEVEVKNQQLQLELF